MDAAQMTRAEDGIDGKNAESDRSDR